MGLKCVQIKHSRTMQATKKAGATKHCSWGICPSDSRYADKLPPETFFIRFPKPGKVKESMTGWEKQQEKQKTLKAKRWIHACGRKAISTKDIKKDTYFCSLHFVGGKGPTDEFPDPLLAHLTDKEQAKRLKKRKCPTPRVALPPKRKRTVVVNPELELCEKSLCESNLTSDQAVTVETCSNQVDKETQTVYDKYILGAKIESILLKNGKALTESPLDPSPSQSGNTMSPDVILADEKKSKYFIGLYPQQFDMLYEFLGKAKFNLVYWRGPKTTPKVSKANSSTDDKSKLTLKEQLFITLLRLRRGFNIFTIAHFYSVTEKYVREIFLTWVMYMYHHFKDHKYFMFPERQVFGEHLPKVFRRFKNVRCSVDCTEFFCQMPRDYAKQGNTYSSYKHHTTMKCLIAVNPNGAACYVSDLYEGSIDDVEIFKQCGILEHINPNDLLLVDKGFTVQHLLLAKQATIEIPAFIGKRDKFTKEEILATKRIAKARIHVERFNERLKKFRLLDRTIPLNLSHVASQLVYVASCLVNFQECLCR